MVNPIRTALEKLWKDRCSIFIREEVTDPETQKTTYKYIATVQPVKGQIWDNRYNAVLEKDEGSELNFTTFKKVAGGDIYPGMLLIEGRYSKL